MAAAASWRSSSVVFVGNIPYHASEDELRATCKEIGPVVFLRVAANHVDDEPVGVEGATHTASLLAPGARPHGVVTLYLAGLSRRQLREPLDALEREDSALMEHAKREFAGLSMLIEQARVLLDMASVPGAAAAKYRNLAREGRSRTGLVIHRRPQPRRRN